MPIHRIRRPYVKQPDAGVRLALNGPLLRGSAVVVISGNDRRNLVSEIPLTVGGAGPGRTAAFGTTGVAFRKNGWLESDPIAAIGTKTFVTFWYGVVSTIQGNGAANAGDDPTFLLGSGGPQLAIVARIGNLRNNSSSWGALYKWTGANTSSNPSVNDFNSAGEALVPGAPALLVVVRRQTGMEFWHDGKMVGFTTQSPYSLPATTLVAGSFVQDQYWNSASDMWLSGVVVADWSADDVRKFSANPWQIFEPSQLPVYSAAAAAVGASLTGAAVAVASAYGALSTSIPLSGSAATQATAFAGLSTAIGLAGVANAGAAASGTLSTSIPLAGAATARSAMSGMLSGGAPTLTGAASVATIASGALSTSIPLAGAALARALATGALADGGALLAGAAVASASAAGTLATSIRLAGPVVVQASATGALSSRIQLAGAVAAVASAAAALNTKILLIGRAEASARAAGELSIARPADKIDISKISPARIVVFEGSGSRIVTFEGSGPRMRFEQMSAKMPYMDGDRHMVDRDPDEESWYGAEITDELRDRNTTAKSVELVLVGVTQLAEPEIQAATIEGVPRTFICAFLGGIDGPVPEGWKWVARVRGANGERFDKTTHFNEVDP